jgi:hypothetical protein
LPNYHFEKLFDPSDADELIPVIAPLLQTLQAAARELRGKIDAIAVDDPAIERMQLPAIIERHPELGELTGQMATSAQAIEAHGCFLKDIDLGLIDFPWEIEEGKVVFLCWQPGEDQIVAWHPVDGGFAQRQPIPGATKPYLN